MSRHCLVLFLFLSLVFSPVHPIPLQTSNDDSPPSFGGRIKHVVALMMENRSFDHFLGFLKRSRPEIDGCLPEDTSNCTCPVDPNDPNSPTITIGNNAIYKQSHGPHHDIDDTTRQLFGMTMPNLTTNTPNVWPPPMNGFIANYAFKGYNGTGIMQCFDNEILPILNTLADEFAVLI